MPIYLFECFRFRQMGQLRRIVPSRRQFSPHEVECAPGGGQDQAAELTVCRAWGPSQHPPSLFMVAAPEMVSRGIRHRKVKPQRWLADTKPTTIADIARRGIVILIWKDLEPCCPVPNADGPPTPGSARNRRSQLCRLCPTRGVGGFCPASRSDRHESRRASPGGHRGSPNPHTSRCNFVRNL
jgi:hypothetical protein